jgi:sporulation protein YlmC with PRC-barrel domain
MARYGTLGDYRFSDMQEAAADIRGADVYGPDDKKLGDIDDVIFDEATGAIVYVVVDTGGWLSSKMFIVPPEHVRPSLQHDGDFLVELTKEQIERLPPYDGGTLTDEEKWADYERRYRSKWVEGPVMHREGTDRNVTPTTKQQVDAGAGKVPASEADLEELDNETEIAPVHPQVEMGISPNTPSYRWTTFEDTLRRRREEVLQASIDNAKRASRVSGDASAERKPADRRKAS